jgi:hypothetical protein
MKTFLLFLAAFLFSFSLYAQNRNVLIGVQFLGGISGLFNQVDGKEQPRFYYASQLSGGYIATDHLVIWTGCGYGRAAWGHRFNDPFLGSSRYEQVNEYIDIPLYAQLRTGRPKVVRCFLNIGASLGLLRSAHYTKDLIFEEWNVVSGQHVDNRTDFRSAVVSPLLGFGIIVPVKERFELSFGPQASFQLGNVSAPLYTAALNVGCSLKL